MSDVEDGECSGVPRGPSVRWNGVGSCYGHNPFQSLSESPIPYKGLCQPKEEEEEQGKGEVGQDRTLAALPCWERTMPGQGGDPAAPGQPLVQCQGLDPGSGNGTDLPAGAGVPQEVVPGHQAVPEADARVAHAAVAAGDGHAGGGRARGHGVDAGVLGARLVGRLATRATDDRAGAQVVFTRIPRATAATLDMGGTDKMTSSPCQSILCPEPLP